MNKLFLYLFKFYICIQMSFGMFISNPLFKFNNYLISKKINTPSLMTNKSKIFKINFNNNDIEEQEFNKKWNEIINRIVLYFCIYYILIYIYFS